MFPESHLPLAPCTFLKVLVNFRPVFSAPDGALRQRLTEHEIALSVHIAPTEERIEDGCRSR